MGRKAAGQVESAQECVKHARHSVARGPAQRLHEL